MKTFTKQAATMLMTALLATWATAAVADNWWRMDCELSSYAAPYNGGAALEVAKGWLPDASTHVLRSGRSYHVEYGVSGSVEAPPNRIIIRYPLYDDNGVRSVVKYTYLPRKGIFIASMQGGGAHNVRYYDMSARGTCQVSKIAEAVAKQLMR